jgi:hypothetical protein
MVSTPNASDGLFDMIEKEPEENAFTNVFFWIILMVLTEYIQKKK